MGWQLVKTPKEIVEEIDRLLDENNNIKIAAILNERGIRSGSGKVFNPEIIAHICQRRGLKNHYRRLRAAGMKSAQELARRFHVRTPLIREWADKGFLKFHEYSTKRQRLYKDPGDTLPSECLPARLRKRKSSARKS
jgi:hypothetical protein